MAVSIEQIDAQVDPQTPALPAPTPEAGHDEPEMEMRRQCALLTRAAQRAARLFAD
jgi:hypothetical protein